VACTIRPLTGQDLPWAEELIAADSGGRLQARLGAVIDALACPGLVAELSGDAVGVVTYPTEQLAVEVVYIVVTTKRIGIGTTLMDAVERQTRPRRLWLVSTNDNLDALRFYQRRGYRIVDIRVGAVESARRTLKPSIPEIGNFGIPIRDEIVLERVPT
jgi:ribosomal protein S18 acetylase RimI-like enzyme